MAVEFRIQILTDSELNDEMPVDPGEEEARFLVGEVRYNSSATFTGYWEDLFCFSLHDARKMISMCMSALAKESHA